MQQPNSTPEYPYTSFCVWWLIHHERLSTAEIWITYMGIVDWLEDNVTGRYILSGDITELASVQYHNEIRFKYEDDILAYKIRWGIHV